MLPVPTVLVAWVAASVERTAPTRWLMCVIVSRGAARVAATPAAPDPAAAPTPTKPANAGTVAVVRVLAADPAVAEGVRRDQGAAVVGAGDGPKPPGDAGATPSSVTVARARRAEPRV